MYLFNALYLLHSYNPSFLICLCFNMVSFRCLIHMRSPPPGATNYKSHYNCSLPLNSSIDKTASYAGYFPHNANWKRSNELIAKQVGTRLFIGKKGPLSY